MLTLAESYQEATKQQDRVSIAESILSRFCDPSSREHISCDPAQLATLKERHEKGLEEGFLPPDLFHAVKGYVESKLESTLPGFFKSEEHYQACRQPNGVLWRVIKLCRLLHRTCGAVSDGVVAVVLDICAKNELTCVRHATAEDRAKLKAVFDEYASALTALKRTTHVVGYLYRELTIKEKLRDSHSQHTLIPAKGQAKLRRNA